ncbi:MAG: hypothetical protein KDL87_17690, partial [Verrucomicrobiae bacterium]|nr:hypothetical protein [Verrucomicrobiae bacterium]
PGGFTALLERHILGGPRDTIDWMASSHLYDLLEFNVFGEHLGPEEKTVREKCIGYLARLVLYQEPDTTIFHPPVDGRRDAGTIVSLAAVDPSGVARKVVARYLTTDLKPWKATQLESLTSIFDAPDREALILTYAKSIPARGDLEDPNDPFVTRIGLEFDLPNPYVTALNELRNHVVLSKATSERLDLVLSELIGREEAFKMKLEAEKEWSPYAR